MTSEKLPAVSSPATKFAVETISYLHELARLFLAATNRYPVQVLLPVVPALQSGFLETLKLMRQGAPLTQDRHETILRDVAESLVEEFEQHYQKVQKARAESAGVKIPFRVLTRGEKEHLRMFVQFLLIRDAKDHFTGKRAIDLEKLHEPSGP